MIPWLRHRLRFWLRHAFWRNGPRRLDVSRSGIWFLLFTITLGVAGLALGNNVVYLVESFLLAGLILSGVLSERVVSALEFEFHHEQAIATVVVQDWIHLTNKSSSPLFSIEFGEIVDGDFVLLAYVPMIKAKDKLSIPAPRVFPRRGEATWEGYAIATSYPFGFAKKTKMIWSPGKRLVWIERIRVGAPSALAPQSIGARGRARVRPIEGEVRAYVTGEDARDLVPAKSAYGLGPMVRNRRLQAEEREVRLDLTQVDATKLEDQLRETARLFYSKEASDLVLRRKSGVQKIYGSYPALHALSLLRAEDCG